MKDSIILASVVVATIIAACLSAQPGPMMSSLRREIDDVERELAKVAALEAEVAQLERTVQIMTPMLADRSAAQRTGDVTGDGRRDNNDLSVWYCCRGAPASQPVSACWFVDMDKNGTVDAADLPLLNAAIKR